MKFVNSDLKDRLLPEVSRIVTYNQLAERTDKTRDPRLLLSLLQKLPTLDRYLFGLIQTRKLAVLGFKTKVKFPDEFITTETEKTQLSAITTRLQRGKIRRLIAALSNAILFGAAAVQTRWEAGTKYGTMITSFRPLELTELDYDPNNPFDINHIETIQNGYLRSQLDTDIVYMRSNPLDGINSDYAGGIVRYNMVYSLLKYYDIFGWASANDKFGDPTMVAEYNKASSPEERAVAKNALLALSKNSAVMPEEIKLRFLEAGGSNIPDLHDKFIAAINAETAISILGQTLTTSIGSTGSFAAAKVHNFVREDYLWADLIQLQEEITAQVIEKDYFENYGEPRNAYPEFEFDIEEAVDRESYARIFEILKQNNVPIKRDELYNRTGFSVPNASEATI